jgi:hypothetical protein
MMDEKAPAVVGAFFIETKFAELAFLQFKSPSASTPFF